MTLRPLVITLALVLVAMQGAQAQSNQTTVRRKPFEAFSASDFDSAVSLDAGDSDFALAADDNDDDDFRLSLDPPEDAPA